MSSADTSNAPVPPTAPAAEPTPSIASPALFDLSGKNVLITGATRGIGAACALALAQAGASICLVVRPNSDNHGTLDSLRALQSSSDAVRKSHSTVEADMSDLESVKTLFTRALDIVPDGEIHVLVNCAGIQRRAPAVDFSDEDWTEVLNTNLSSIFVLCRAAGKHMIPKRRGKIINFGSLLSFQGGLTVPAYAAAKGGLAMLTKALSNEWAKENIQVNAICPGYIATDMNEGILTDPNRLRQISERIPAGRWGAPADFAGPCVFLASSASQYVSGELLVVDGGWMGR